MDEYARSYGHEPAENWILVVHPDDTSHFYTFDDPMTMWCCERKGAIRGALREEFETKELVPARNLAEKQGGIDGR